MLCIPCAPTLHQRVGPGLPGLRVTAQPCGRAAGRPPCSLRGYTALALCGRARHIFRGVSGAMGAAGASPSSASPWSPWAFDGAPQGSVPTSTPNPSSSSCVSDT